MTISNYLGQLWGITIVVVSFTLLINPDRLDKLVREMENEAAMFFGGIITLIIGVAMVLAHNIWVLDWRLSLTLLGWLSILKGLDILFLPKRMKKRWAKTENKHWRLIFLFLLILGLTLIYFGFYSITTV
jgi:hypothetical protein